jgi:hypothetical protein
MADYTAEITETIALTDTSSTKLDAGETVNEEMTLTDFQTWMQDRKQMKTPALTIGLTL